MKPAVDKRVLLGLIKIFQSYISTLGKLPVRLYILSPKLQTLKNIYLISEHVAENYIERNCLNRRLRKNIYQLFIPSF